MNHSTRIPPVRMRREWPAEWITDVTAAADPGAVERARSREVAVEVVRQIGAEQNLAATALRDEGKLKEARVAFEANAQFLQQNAVELQDEELSLEAESNKDAGESVDDDAAWKRERKAQQMYQYKTQQSLPQAKRKSKE